MARIPANPSETLSAIFVLLLLMILIGCNRSDRQEGYPDRPIKLIVPFSAGGGTDNFARVIKQAIEDNQLLPEPIVIINIDGGGATNGSRRVKVAKPDGYTMLVLHDAILTAKASGMVNYGPEAFELVGATGEVGMVVAVWDRPESHKNLRDLLEDAKKRPNEITFGVNMGALTHYAGLVLQNQMPGAEFRYVQLGGGSKRFASLKGGHTDVTGFSLEEFVRFRPDGVRGLAYFGDERHRAASDVPTAKEQGFDIVNRNTFYWWVPKGTPQDRIAVLADALRKAMATDHVKQKMDALHMEPFFEPAEPAAKRLQRSVKQYENVALRDDTTLPDLPLIVVIATTAMGGVVIALEWSRSRRQVVKGTESKPSKAADFQRRFDLAAICLVVIVGYVAVMNWIGYAAATVAFLLVTGGMLTRWRLQSLPIVSAIALGFGLGTYWLFKFYFTVDLP